MDIQNSKAGKWSLRNFERRKQEFVFPDLNEKPVQHISIKYSHPEWMVKRWLKELG